MQKNYCAWFQQLFIARNFLALNFLFLALPWMFSEFVAYKQQYAVKGKNNAILLLEQASKFFAVLKYLNNRRLHSNKECMT